MSHGNSQDGKTPRNDHTSVGRALQQARQAAKLTVEEVSASTRVRIPIVRAIEDDDFSRCGGDVYARGHIRTLARAVGADPAVLIARFNQEQGEAEPDITSTAPVFDAERIRPEPRRPNWTAAMVAAIAAVVGFGAFTLVNGNDDGGGGAVAEGTPSATDDGAGEPDDAESPDPTDDPADPSPEPEPSESAIAGAPADKVTMKLEATATTWVMVTGGNGQQLFQATMEPGDSETLTDDEQLDLVTGNAGGLELYINGRHIEDIGASGEVFTDSFTPGDPEEG